MSANRTGSIAFPVRAASGSDIDEVAAIERSLFSDPWGRRSFADLLTSPWVIFLVAADDTGAVAGYAVLLAAGDESELANLAVAREVQRSGIGRRLLAAGMLAARDRGCRHTYLEVRASNVPAMALYGSMRFRPVGRRARYYAHPVEDAIVMRADLDDGRPDGGEADSPNPGTALR